jgi:Phosphoinositide phospholipase C, Ca2+-dependent
VRLGVALAVLLGCGGGEERRVYPRDDELTIADLQVKGTHNSYHVMTSDIEAWHYTHVPLDEQLADQGVRQLELDLRADGMGGFRVAHIPLLDEGTTCATFVDCLGDVRRFSDDERQHLPIVILVEIKDAEADAAAFDELEREILAVMSPARVILPAEVRGSAATVRDAIEERGWPSLGTMRGRVMFVLLDSGEIREAYLARGEGALFAAGGLGDRFAAVALLDDPVTGGADIEAMVREGMIVRTRADVDGVEATTNDVAMREAALDSGAQFISTDFPAVVDGVTYVVDIPGGSPARCNPITAPPGCTPSDLE